MDSLLLEEKINRLTAEDGRILARRESAVKWLRARLSAALRDGAGAIPGLSGELWGQFRRGESPGFDEVAERLLARLELSQERARQYAALLSQSRRQAAAWLWDELLERELRVLAARAGISEATWWRFRRARAYPSGALAEKLARALGLTPAEEDELRGLFLRGKFDDAGPLKSAIQRGIASRGLTVTAFREDAYISRKAWRHFEPGGRGPVSQGTLLKLVIALRLAPEEGWNFLALIESGFYMECDLVFLAYMHLACAQREGRAQYVPEQLASLLEEFSLDSATGERYFGNPYPPEACYAPQA